MSSEITDPEVLAFIARTERFFPASHGDMSVKNQRVTYDRMTAEFRRPLPDGIASENGGFDGPGCVVPIRRYWPKKPGMARVLYFHGGGFVVGGLDSHDDICGEISETCEVEVVSVDYRLCPEHAHPAAYEDAVAAVDTFADRPLVVVGDSAGGNLAAAAALARPHKIWGQVLIYPGLGGERLDLLSYTERANAPMLTTEDVRYYGTVRAGGVKPPVDDPSFAPLSARDLKDIPPCFVSAAEYDPLRDDGTAYVLRLTDAGVAAEAVVEDQLPHGHLRARAMSARAAAAFDRVCGAIKRFTKSA